MKTPRSAHSFRQAAVWSLFAILAALSNMAWAAAGYVHQVSGAVRMENGSATTDKVKAGDMFDSGATFRTAADGKVVIKFEDGQIVSLQPNTAFRVEGYSFNANNPKAGTSALKLFQGAMRFVTGLIGSTNRNNVSLAAGTATIGIRGTDITVLVDATTQAVEAAIAAGAAVLQTPQGVSNIAVGQFVSHRPDSPPTSAAPVAAGRAALQAVVTALQAAPIPVNTPVVVASAARAAAAVAQARAAQAAAAADPGNAQLQAQAERAEQQAEAATQTAVAEAQAALQTAIQNGAVPPAPPATLTTTDATSPAAPQPASALPTYTPPPVTPPPVTCGGSPC